MPEYIYVQGKTLHNKVRALNQLKISLEIFTHDMSY